MTRTAIRTGKDRILTACRIAPTVLVASTLVIGGCAQRRGHAIPWATAILVRPVTPAPAANGAKETADLAPDLKPELPPPPTELAGRRPGPMRPRIAPASADDSPVPAPTLAPQLTPQELALARQQTNDSLSVAGRNLQAARGRYLNAMQSDLVSKIVSFSDEARKAASEGDWTRARNLAKKAEVLSEELAAQF